MTLSSFDLLNWVRDNHSQINPESFDFSKFKLSIVDVGVIQLTPKLASDEFAVISVGVHGNETAPIEIVTDVLADIVSGKQPLAINLLIIVGNPQAMLTEERFIDVNLNRLFCSAWQEQAFRETIEGKRAAVIEQRIAEFFGQAPTGSKRYHYDLHTAIKPSRYPRFAIYPYLETREHSQEQLNFLGACGIEAVLLYHKASTTLSYHSSSIHHAHAFTLELGKVQAFGANHRPDFAQFEQALREFIAHKANTSTQHNMPLFMVCSEVLKAEQNDHLSLPSDFTNFSPLEQGYELLSNDNNSYLIEQTGDAIVFPNNAVPIGQRMALVVRKK